MGKIIKNGISYTGGGAEGKSAYQTWLDLGNTGTEQDFIDSLGGGGSFLYVVTGSLDIENEDNSVILNQTFEEIKTAYDKGKTIIADILVAGEAQYIFNLLYVLEDAIAFEWINSAAKVGGQINLMNDNTATFVMTSLEGGSDTSSTLVITGNYSVDDEDNWVVSNIDKTFAEIDEAISNNQDVVLKIYPEGDTTNPYILHPAMHYANMGTAFSLMISDEGQISGLSVMITADNQVMATRNEYEFEEFYKELDEIKKSVSDGKSAVAGAITAKGIDTAADAEFAIMAENINKIGTDHNLVFKQSNITDKSLTPVFGNGVFIAYHSTDKVVYYSKDGGETWNTSSLNVSTSTGAKIVYAKKHKIFIGKFTGVGLYTSYDGNTWTLRLSATNVNDFLYDDVTGIAIAGHSSGSNGLWYSHNGYNWTVNGSYSGKKISNFKAAGGRLYAKIDSGMYTSLNGSTWTAISSFSSQTIGSIRYEHGLWMANLSSASAGNSWYYSTDGVTFTKATVTFNDTTYGTDFMDFKHIVGTTWVIVMYTGIWYTIDSGKNWTASNLGIKTGNWSLFAYADKFYAASAGGPGSTYGGLYYSTDGKTWTATTGITDGASGASTSGKTFILQGKCFISPSGSTTLRGIYYLNSNGTSWTKVDSLTEDYVIYADDDILITRKGKYSFDGINWKNVDKSDLNNISAELANIYYGGGSLISSLSPATSGMIYAHLVK